MHPVMALGRWALALVRVPRLVGTWKQAAEACGVTLLERRRWFGLMLEGRVEGMSVTLQPKTRGSMPLTSIRVGGVGDLDVVQCGASRDGLPEVVHERPVVATGDVDFDRAFQLRGDMLSIQAVFDAGTRRALSDLFAGELHVPPLAQEGNVRVTLSRGELRVEVPGHGSEWLREILAQVLDLARRLGRPPELATALARNATDDPVPGVRLHNLQRLIEDYPRHAATRPILKAACADEREEVRLEAALALGGEGHDVLRALAVDAKDVACAARAVRELGAKMEPAELLAVYDAARERRRWTVAEECLDGLRGRGGALALERLEGALREETRGLARAAARALARLPGEGAEDLLLRLGLTHSSAAVAVAAAEALGQIGTAASVLPLREAAEQRGPELKRAALQAVDDIKVRLGDARPGQLSIASDNSGAVSIAAEGGQLSLPGGRARS
jgi:HEAT repeat protein